MSFACFVYSRKKCNIQISNICSDYRVFHSHSPLLSRAIVSDYRLRMKNSEKSTKGKLSTQKGLDQFVEILHYRGEISLTSTLAIAAISSFFSVLICHLPTPCDAQCSDFSSWKIVIQIEKSRCGRTMNGANKILILS